MTTQTCAGYLSVPSTSGGQRWRIAVPSPPRCDACDPPCALVPEAELGQKHHYSARSDVLLAVLFFVVVLALYLRFPAL